MIKLNEKQLEKINGGVMDWYYEIRDFFNNHWDDFKQGFIDGWNSK